MRVGKKAPSLKSATHILHWWNLAQLYLTQKRSKKYLNPVTNPLSPAEISIFPPEISKSCYIKKYRYRLHSGTFLFFCFSWVFKDVFNNLVITLRISAKMAASDLLRKTVFWNKGYYVIIPVDDVTYKILSRDSNYVVDMFMWPKFGNSIISMRQVITTFDQKNRFFLSYFKCGSLGLALGTNLKFYSNVETG